MFDELEDTGFADLCNLIISEEYGEENFVPYPNKGKDGNIDGKHLDISVQQPRFQFKWREVGSGDDTPLRSAMLKTFGGYLAEERAHGRSGKVVFITNVRQTARDREKAEEIIGSYPEFQVEYWGFEKLRHFMIKHDGIRDKMLPVYTSSELRRQKLELKKRKAEIDKRAAAEAKKDKERLRRTPEFQAAALKLKRLHIDWTRLEDQYVGFVYLVEPVYVDDQDGARGVVRDLFGIDDETERTVLEKLQAAGRIDITGNVITIVDAKDAAKATAQIVEHMGADLERIITLIQGA